MIRPNNSKLNDKFGPVKGVPGATNKPLPPVYKQSPAYMGPFVQGANQQSRLMGWDGVKEQPRQRNPTADGVAPAQMINPLGKVGGGGALPSMVAKQRPPAQQRPVQQTQTSYYPQQQAQYQSQPQQPPQRQPQQPQQPQSMQNFIQPMNQPAARVPTNTPQSQPSKQPLRSTSQQPRQMSQIQPPQSTQSTQQQPLRQAPVQQAPPPNAQIELLKKEINELKVQVESMKDNTEQIYELQDSLGKLINKVDSIEWDSYSFEADIAVASGVGVWEELPADSIDVHVDNIARNTSSSTSDKIFKEGEHIRIHYPLAEFNVEMHDGTIQKWRFARTRIFKSEGWLLDDVFFPLEISAAFLPGADVDPQNQDFSLVTTVSNIKV